MSRLPVPAGYGLAALLLAGSAGPGAAGEPRLTLWTLDPAGTLTGPPGPDAPIPVGSLQKPFVAKAWALTHADQPAPRYTCAPNGVCWFRPGHGELGLAAALTLSCNGYFLHLAEAVPAAALADTLEAAGFRPRPASARAAIGLDGPEGPLRIAPAALLTAYARLVREPWPAGEAIRQEVLTGLREAALTGTAAGVGHRGFWAKTGTVPAADGDPRHTCGLALAVDAAGWAILARVEPGRGREAAQALAAPIARLRPWARPAASPAARTQLRRSAPDWDAVTAEVRVRLFELLSAPRYQVRNLGPDPVPCADGYLGPGASRDLRPGDRIGPGLLELDEPASGAVRRIQGELGCQARGAALQPIARIAPREYVSGVLAAEAPGAGAALRRQLGAAVLRFLAEHAGGPGLEVGDSTRSALFIGRGPRLDWSARTRARPLAAAVDPPLSDAEWTAIRAAAASPGPSQWSRDDGGRPLSAREVWGGADPAPPPGPPRPSARPWTRTWPAAQLERAFGAPVQRLQVARDDGVWVLRVSSGASVRSYRYDQAHRRLAAAMGWNALPSPADRVDPVPGGFQATGVGQGHRVGLSLKP